MSPQYTHTQRHSHKHTHTLSLSLTLSHPHTHTNTPHLLRGTVPKYCLCGLTVAHSPTLHLPNFLHHLTTTLRRVIYLYNRLSSFPVFPPILTYCVTISVHKFYISKWKNVVINLYVYQCVCPCSEHFFVDFCVIVLTVYDKLMHIKTSIYLTSEMYTNEHNSVYVAAFVCVPFSSSCIIMWLE